MTSQFNLPSPEAIERSLAGTPSPLAAVLTTANIERVQPNQSYQIGVTVSNLGQKSAVISAYINEQNPILRQWFLGLEQRLALGPGQSGEVFFRFQIPADAIAGLYEYDLIIDSPEDYPATILRYAHRQIQVLPPERNQAIAQDPTFGVETPNSPDAPLQVQSGVATLVHVFVENRTDRVDRYRLQCTGLPTDWTTKVQYPANLAGVGLIAEADSLGLNPGERKQLQVLVQSPTTATAGSYIPTLRLSSENQPELGLLDLVYLKIASLYQLQPQLQIHQNQVSDSPAQFEIQILNSGNTDRHLKLSIQSPDEPHDCTYTLSTQELSLRPQSVHRVPFQAEPHPQWKRPWLGSGRLYNFQVILDDQEQLPLTPRSLPGYFTWTARPGWQLLLTALLLLGTVAGLAGFIWWMFLQTPAPSEVQEFAAEDSQYSEAAEEAARVRWEIENPEQLRSLQLTGLSPEGEVLSGPLSYDFTDLAQNQGPLPKSLAPYCKISQTTLACSNVPTDARKPGQYIFELTLTPRKGAKGKAIALKSKPVTILARPLPEVEVFKTEALFYQEIGFDIKEQNGQPIPASVIPVQWVVNHPENLQGLQLSVRDAEGISMETISFNLLKDEFGNPRVLCLPQEEDFSCSDSIPIYSLGNEPSPSNLASPNSPYCFIENNLSCQNVLLPMYELGTYQLELTPIPIPRSDIDLVPNNKDNSVDLASKKTEPITIQPRLSFIANLQVNYEDALSRSYYPFPVPWQIDLDEPEAPPFLDFPIVPISWKVVGGRTTQVELLPGPGSVPLEGEIYLPLKHQYGVTTVTLRVTDGTGQSISQVISLETFDPYPVNPIEAATLAAEAAAETSAQINAVALERLQQQQVLQQEAQLEQQWALQQQLLEQSALPPSSFESPAPSSSATTGGAELLRPESSINAESSQPRSVQGDSEQLTPAESQPIFQ